MPTQAQKFALLYTSIGSPPGSPGPPTSLAATYDMANTEIDVSWMTPADPGDSAIIDYQVQSMLDGGGFADLEANSTDLMSTLDNPMDMGNVYGFRVRARNTQGAGPWSDVASVTVGTAPMPMPSDGGLRFGGMELLFGGSKLNFGVMGPTPVMRTTIQDTIAFPNLNAFTAAFTGEMVGTDQGRWRFDAAGSSQSSSTGPGTNNALPFVHTETSSMTTAAQGMAMGRAAFAVVPAGTSRRIRGRFCIQGAFDDGMEGLQFNARATDTDTWEQAGFVYGWAYSNSRDEGDTITDYNGAEQTIVADGGWVDFEIDIPDTAMQVEMVPMYTFGDGSTFHHDIAFREFEWIGVAA